jgi:hypothetical protein
MLNVKTLTDTLSRMELPELQDYATLHKNNPYVVTMALSIANQKKQMKAAQDGQAGMQPQPKVVDQQISQMAAPPPQQMAAAPQQQMLPEDTGIGQLPAQNMQRLAEGGIVAFEDGGSVPGYAGPTGSFIDPLANYLKQIGMSAQEFISKNGNEQQQIRAAATANKPLVPPPAVPVAQAAQAAQAAASTPGVGTPPVSSGLATTRAISAGMRKLPVLGLIYEMIHPDNKEQERASLPYKLGAASAVDEQGTRVAAAKESAEAYAARKIKEFEATLPAGQKMSPEARNKETDRLIAEKIALELATKRQPVDPTGQNPVDPIKSTSFKTDKGYTNDYNPATATRRSMYVDGGGGGAGAPAPSAEDKYMSGVNKLLKSSQTASTMGPMTQLDAKRYSFTPAEMAKIEPKDFAAALDAAMPKDQVASPFDTRQEALNKANVATRENAKTALEKQFKEQGLAFEDTLNKLTAKEKRVQTMQDNQLGMALLEAGLNMMAGESPHAMVNIGKGAQVGTKKYMELQNQIEAYRDKIDDTKMKIDEYRRNEANMNARELRAAQRDIDDSVSSGAQAMINLAREQYGLNRNQAISFVSNSMQMQQFNVGQKNQAAMHNQQTAANIDTAYAQMANQRDIADKARSTQLGIAALEAKYRKDNPAAGSLGFFKALAPDGDPVKGMKLYSESLGPEGKGSEAILLDWQKKSPIEKQMARKLDPMGSAQLDRQLQERVLQGSISDKPAGTVLDQTR